MKGVSAVQWNEMIEDVEDTHRMVSEKFEKGLGGWRADMLSGDQSPHPNLSAPCMNPVKSNHCG